MLSKYNIICNIVIDYFKQIILGRYYRKDIEHLYNNKSNDKGYQQMVPAIITFEIVQPQLNSYQ